MARPATPPTVPPTMAPVCDVLLVVAVVPGVPEAAAVVEMVMTEP